MISVNRVYGGQSEIEPLRRVLVRRPDAAFAVDDPARWHYTSRPDLAVAQAEHDAFVNILRRAGADVVYHDCPQPGRADSIFVRDPAIVTDHGAVILSPGKDLRRGEEMDMADAFEELGIPILYRLHGDARAEGGDMFWLDQRTLAVGQGFRTNAEGLRQLHEALEPVGVTAIPVELPYFQGQDACLHLMSLISPVDRDLAVVYPPLMAVSFWQLLGQRGIQLIVVPDEEFLTMGTNVLALAPRTCLMLEGNPITRRRLEETGCEVLTYTGREVSLKAEGGPTCLTRPILRGAS